MIVKTLPVGHTLYIALQLVIADKDLLDVFKVAVVFPSETFELLLEPVPRLPSLCDHVGKVLSKLVLGLCQGHNIYRQLFVFLSEHGIL